jgi:hypothetical protein
VKKRKEEQRNGVRARLDEMAFQETACWNLGAVHVLLIHDACMPAFFDMYRAENPGQRHRRTQPSFDAHRTSAGLFDISNDFFIFLLVTSSLNIFLGFLTSPDRQEHPLWMAELGAVLKSERKTSFSWLLGLQQKAKRIRQRKPSRAKESEKKTAKRQQTIPFVCGMTGVSF